MGVCGKEEKENNNAYQMHKSEADEKMVIGGDKKV